MKDTPEKEKIYDVELLSVHLAKLPDEGTSVNIIPNESLIQGGLFSKHFIDYLCNEIGKFTFKSLGEYEEALKKLEEKKSTNDESIVGEAAKGNTESGSTDTLK